MQKVSNRNYLLISCLIVVAAVSLFLYLMWYVSPNYVTENVKIISNNNQECVVETLDGYAITIKSCNGLPGEIISAEIDVKLKERAALMNPTGR